MFANKSWSRCQKDPEYSQKISRAAHFFLMRVSEVLILQLLVEHGVNWFKSSMWILPIISTSSLWHIFFIVNYVSWKICNWAFFKQKPLFLSVWFPFFFFFKEKQITLRPCLEVVIWWEMPAWCEPLFIWEPFWVMRVPINTQSSSFCLPACTHTNGRTHAHTHAL